ncbi:MAG: hypothetical protein EOP35_19545 [Rubrivivax sp.]|nr:MAG: hypothetical protein EOP35_19545 [Rubrivivax sp.]
MPQLMIPGPVFYSSHDEANFFTWLQNISGVARVVGKVRDLQVTLRSSRLGEQALREMIALHWRYQMPMRHLSSFLSATNERWFAAVDGYWHNAVFGASV